MAFAGYFTYLLVAETLLLVVGQSLYDYSYNAEYSAGYRRAVRRAGRILKCLKELRQVQVVSCAS